MGGDPALGYRIARLSGPALWKFFAHENGVIRPSLHEPCEGICDAFVWVLRQEAGRADMTVLARMGLSKPRWGKPAVETIHKFWRFGHDDAVALAMHAASQVQRLAADKARESGRSAAEYAAESARAAALATYTTGDASALQAAAYSVVYAIQAGDRADIGDRVTLSIEKWLFMRLRQMASSGQ